MLQIIECVPNFSEGRNLTVVSKIAEAIRETRGVRLLNIDRGISAPRTVMTFAGNPASVMEAAFSSIRAAAELIDMREHHGIHPRFGAVDVCPLVPVSGITMEETAGWARKLARKVGEELSIPVYCYGYASAEQRTLADCRSGEDEGLRQKFAKPGGKPDFGPEEWSARVAKTGALAVGARNMLVAFNVNLDTDSVGIARSIAAAVRESGGVLREGDPVSGKIVRGKDGSPVRKPGRLKKVRAIGWAIPEYGCAQVSMNLEDITATPVHVAFEEVRKEAGKRGVRVTGSELVGLIPLRSLLEAGRYYLGKQKQPEGIKESELIETAIQFLGLSELNPFEPDKRIFEYLLGK